MTKRVKRLQKLFTNPKTVTFKELDAVLSSLGLDRRQPSSGSSHYTYTTKDNVIITVPYKRPYIKEVYIKRVREVIGDLYEKKS